jgi:hypothetical protein
MLGRHFLIELHLYPKEIYIYIFSFYRKGLIGVWYCNLRNPVKATSLGHPRQIEARPQYKAFNIYIFLTF